MTLSAIIVSYNVKHYVEQCIASLLRAAENIDMEVFVVDNNSSDGTIDYLKQAYPKKRYPQIHIFANKQNVGFGRANNQALARCKGEYVLFINPDTLVSENVLNECVAFFRSHPDAGTVGVRMLNPNGTFALESRRGLPTPFKAACRMLGLSRLFPKSRTFGGYNMQYLDEHEVNEIQVVSGAFMMMPHAVLDNTGGFDERFFMYGEDIDLSYRSLKAGCRNYYVPCPILHYKGESTEKSSFRYVHVFYDAMLIYFNKHYKRSFFLISIPVKTAIYLAAFCALVQRTFDNWRQWLRPATKENGRYLFIGNRDSFEDVRTIAQEWGLDIDFMEGTQETLPEGHTARHIDARPYRYIVYDMSAYPVKSIFSYFEKTKSAQIGTYYPQRGVLITKDKSFQL